MDLCAGLGVFNYGLVLIFGLFLSVFISGGWGDQRQKRLVWTLCPLFLAIQSPCWLLWGEDAVKQIYPLIVHLPLVLILVLGLKRRVDVAVVSVCTAYLCCQLPRWVDLVITAATRSPLLGEIGYTLFIGPIFFLLYRFFVRPAYAAVSSSHQSLMLFGSLPVVYYFFDYATVVYSDALYRGIGALNEFLPTALLLFYVLFLTAYHAQMQRRADTELQRSMLEAELKQSAVEMEGLRSAENQTAIYQHDMRHHLNAISALLAAGEPEQAEEYIRGVRSDIEAITPKRYCGNELVNLLCSSFENKARRAGARLTVDAKLPGELSISDTELCSILSNALENALRAVEKLEDGDRWVSLYCGVRLNKLLIEVKNPYAGQVALGDGLPRSERQGHRYGCRSIQTIAQRRGGLCQFRAEDGVFSVQLMLPVKEDIAEKG